MTVPEPRKLSSGNYFIQLRLGGESVPVTASTAKACKDKATLIKAEHRAGERETRKNKTNPTLRQAIDDYIAARSNTLSPSTIRGYHSIRNNRFKSVIDKPIKDIDNWQKICNDEAKTCSPKTLRNSWWFIVSVLKSNNQEPPSPTLPQMTENTRPWLEPEQISEFTKAVHGKDVEIPALLALHGLRRSEICGLDWKNIDMKKKCVTVKGALVQNKKQEFVYREANKNKTSKRIVPIMIPELAVALEAVPNKTGRVIKCAPTTIYKQINKVCRDNGFPEVGVHGLRHSFASLAYHLGMPEKQCMQLGGWSDNKTMHTIYTHLAEADVKKYENVMSNFYKNANKNANANQKV